MWCGSGHCVVIDVVCCGGRAAEGGYAIGMEMEGRRVKGEIAMQTVEIVVEAGGEMTVFVLATGCEGAGGDFGGYGAALNEDGVDKCVFMEGFVVVSVVAVAVVGRETCCWETRPIW
mmetsp:Transcript_3182/g.6054  ORF Transcript_3182/g.6054 Transcript_3182/m.6054 type:complete len:117 (+) Transcript_3182:756-1106(+)